MVSREYLPAKLPFASTTIWCLLLDRIAAPWYVWVVVLALQAMVWGLMLSKAKNEESRPPQWRTPV